MTAEPFLLSKIMAKTLNLFGDMQEIDPVSEPKSKYQRFKSMYHYRESIGAERCKNCINCIVINYHNKNYYKCEIMGISNSEASDIRIKMICDRWRLKDYYK